MTINKAQGQSLKYVGINLAEEVFGHGQLYVAFSRATVAGNVKVIMPGGDVEEGQEVRKLTRNVVYEEVL
jgi:ATP-dependent exoDNAse (exonuclease V) alpha subunit